MPTITSKPTSTLHTMIWAQSDTPRRAGVSIVFSVIHSPVNRVAMIPHCSYERSKCPPAAMTHVRSGVIESGSIAFFNSSSRRVTYSSFFGSSDDDVLPPRGEAGFAPAADGFVQASFERRRDDRTRQDNDRRQDVNQPV